MENVRGRVLRAFTFFFLFRRSRVRRSRSENSCGRKLVRFRVATRKKNWKRRGIRGWKYVECGRARGQMAASKHRGTGTSNKIVQVSGD